MTRMARLALALAVLGPLAASDARGNHLINGDFENQPNFGAGVYNDPGFSALTGAQIPGWIIEAGRAATVHNTVFYPTISGTYSVNMDGEGYGGGNANLHQDFASALGDGYLLSFDWSGWQVTSARLNVSITDTVTSAVLFNGNYAWAGSTFNETAAFVGTGNALRLRVQENPESGFNDNGFMVDNFSVVTTFRAVPEPSSLALLGLGGLPIGGVLWRARRRQALPA